MRWRRRSRAPHLGRARRGIARDEREASETSEATEGENLKKKQEQREQRAGSSRAGEDRATWAENAKGEGGGKEEREGKGSK